MIKIFFILNRKVTPQKHRCVGCWLLALPRAQMTSLSRILGIWFTYYVPVLINFMTPSTPNTFLSRTRASIYGAFWDFFSWAKLLMVRALQLSCSRRSNRGEGAKRCEWEKQRGGGVGGERFPPLSLSLTSLSFLLLSHFALNSTIWTPYRGYIGMCRCEGYGFQAVYSRIGHINQSVGSRIGYHFLGNWSVGWRFYLD